ncbi:S9 family peptidase [Parendozoicomonas haliclonae]|uniref:Protease 2 n=1 Tax=Parendozoicomonas haliclonae TaxID=1960125 RepID=A0A1X7AHN6_9GAMM|nr:S9 family peptidase [Parendozoicomonas haliclonae]SMA42880.1 Protease 2 [Parendozoicomonas haliclonae]
MPVPAPVAPKVDHIIKQHGTERNDPYHWLRDDNWQKFIAGDLDFANPAVKTYIDAENAYKDDFMADYKGIQKDVYNQILSRIKEDDQSCPFKKGEFFYYSREEKGKNYPILCRKFQTLDAPEDIYFDVNAEAADHELYMFGDARTNRSQTFFAYSFNLTGSMERTIKVRDLTTGKDLNWEFANSTGSYLWDGEEHLYIVERDESARGRDIFRVNIHSGERELIFSKPEKYDSMFLSLSQTTDRKYMLAYLSSGASHCVFVSKTGTHTFDEFAFGSDDVSFSLDHYQGDFYILTNDGDATNFKIMKCPVDKNHWEREHWQTFVAEHKELCLNSLSFYNHFLITERRNNNKALDELVVLDMNSGKEQIISMPDEAYSLGLIGDCDDQSTIVKFDYESPTQQGQVFELDLVSGATTNIFTKETPNFDASQYVVKREFAKARDGELVPLTIIHRKDLPLDGTAKAMVYGYGSYGFGMPAFFSAKRFSLVDRGFVFAVAHIRGGDDKGYQWYLNGKMQKKMNTFNDFIDSCEHLIGNGYTRQGQIAINGGSAGGLLMGAVTNMRPELFGCVIADVAFSDVITTISDASLPLTPPEWEEWGNPIESKDDFDYIRQYSPYDNITAKDYPPMLFNSGISDEQVTYWEPAKMVARLRELKTDNNPVLLNMKMHAGHAGASKRYEWIDEAAFDYAFVLKCFDMK